MRCYEDHDYMTCPRCGREDYITVYLPHVEVQCGHYYDFDTAGEMVCGECVHELAMEVEAACERWDRKETKVVEVYENDFRQGDDILPDKEK